MIPFFMKDDFILRPYAKKRHGISRKFRDSEKKPKHFSVMLLGAGKFWKNHSPTAKSVTRMYSPP